MSLGGVDAARLRLHHPYRGGHHCVGAKVNGVVAPLTHELQMGDRVEILTNKNSKPSRDWLSIVKTPSARSKIRHYFAAVTKDDDAAAGRDARARPARARLRHLDPALHARAKPGVRRAQLQAARGPLRRSGRGQADAQARGQPRAADTRPQAGASGDGGGLGARGARPREQPPAAGERQGRLGRGGQGLVRLGTPRAPRSLLQPRHGRRHRRLHHARARRVRAPGGLPQREGHSQSIPSA